MNEKTMFYEGQNNIDKIFFTSSDGQICANQGEIVVSMENGQCAGVPWFNVFDEKGNLISKWNASLCEGVTFKERT
jgi:hypothetical protein